MDDIATSLEKEYCPPLDASTFYSCFLDYAADKVSLDVLRDTLDILKEVTLTTDDTAFDPSGTSGLHDDISSHEPSERAQSWHGDTSSDITENTDLTSVSQALESVTFGASGGRADGLDLTKEQYDSRLEALPFEEKLRAIKDIIPEAKDFDISYTLNKYHNNFNKALDDLLNQKFLENGAINGEEKLSKKGVDAFMEPAMSRRKRTAMKQQKKKESRQLLRRTSSTPKLDPTRDSPLPSNQWIRVDDLVRFLSDRTYLSPELIRSTYHSSGATLSSTIAALCASKDPEVHSNPYISSASLATLEMHVKELAMEFPNSLQFHQALALIKLTHPSPTSAREMALALTSSSNVPSSSTITPQYLLRPPSPLSSTQTPASSLNSSVPLPESRAATLASIRSNAHTQSQSASRKAKSDHLMGGAASYYNSVSRDAAAALRQNEAARADAQVDSQSKPGEVDLHGLNVKDAVRVSRDRVEAWWENEGREWARAGKVMNDGGLRIITGLGRHSAGGRAVLGPAVCRMLNSEGWRVQVGEGVVMVAGRARR